MLYKVFIDDSGKKEYKNPYSKDFITHPPPFEKYEEFWRDNYFVLCGVRIKQEDLTIINSKINQLKKEYFGTHRVKFGRDWTGKTKSKEGKAIINFYPYFDRIRCNFLYTPSNMQVRGIGLTCIPDVNKVNWDLLEGCFDNKKTSH